MARENTVYLYGRLIADPKNRMDKENNPISSRMILQTLRRSYANDEMILQGKIIPDTPIVISRNPELIERMHLSELEKGDFVYVKGTVCTMETRKRYICPRCGHENVKQEGVIVYIDPIYVRKTENDFNEHIKIIEQYLEERIWNLSQFSEDYRPMEVNRIVQILPSCKELRAYLIQQYPGKRFIKENMDDVGNHLSNYKKALEAGDDVSDFKDIFLGDKQSLEQYAFHHLKNRQEISNQVFIMGTLCMEPEYYANEDSRLQTCQFPIASNRLRRIKEDGADKKTDYPWVKCFGPMAEQHSICLHEDINDTDQSIYFPNIGTTATDKADGDHSITAAKQVTIVDKVEYKNLAPGEKHHVKGTLMDKATGKALMVNGKEVTAEAEFTPDKSEGSVNVEFTFNAKNLGGKDLVVFEKMYDANGNEVANHEDINDEGQTVKIVKAPVTPSKTPVTPTKVQTGDHATMYVLLGVAVILLLGGGVMVFKKKKK